MIEKHLISNELTLKRYRRFKKESWQWHQYTYCPINSFNIYCAVDFKLKAFYINYKGEGYFPIFKTYHPKELGITDSLTIDWKNLNKEDVNSEIWPVVKWDPFESNKEVDSYPSAPSGINLMGTDDRGRDVPCETSLWV